MKQNALYIARWPDETFTVFIGLGSENIFDALDAFGDPCEAEVREIPPRLRSGWMTLNQENKDDAFDLAISESTDVEEMLWKKCKKVVWPTEA